jgi:hypothetical protein
VRIVKGDRGFPVPGRINPAAKSSGKYVSESDWSTVTTLFQTSCPGHRCVRDPYLDPFFHVDAAPAIDFNSQALAHVAVFHDLVLLFRRQDLPFLRNGKNSLAVWRRECYRSKV